MSPAASARWGDPVLWGAGALLLVSLLAVLALAAFAPHPAFALAVPLAGAGVVAFRKASAHPLTPLAGLLLLAAFALSRSEGVQPIELAFAAYFYGFIGMWFVRRLFVFREPVVRDSREAVLLWYPVMVGGSLVTAQAYGFDLSMARNAWVSFSALWIYFPIREACERHARGPALVVAGFCVMAATAFVRNVVQLQRTFTEAEYAWEVARARATSNEILILSAALFCIALAASSKRWRGTALGALGFGVFSLGLILTQWRAYYAALALGTLLLTVLLKGRSRKRLVFIGMGSLACVVGAAYVALGDAVSLLALGLLDRVLSIGTAGSADVSLLNRVFESAAQWDLIKQSPIVGYGIGTQFSFFDATTYSTWTKPYSHNGYFHLWFKFGIIGLTAFLYAWGRSTWDGWRAYRAPGASVEGLAAAITLIAVIPSSFVSNPFSTTDVLLCFGILMGTAAGCRARASGAAAPGVSELSAPRAGTSRG